MIYDILSNLKRTFLVLCLGVFCLIVLQIGRSANALNIAQGYKAGSDVGAGMAVSLSKNSTPDSAQVELSKRANLERFVGIVTTVEQTVVSAPQQNSDVLVANSGEVTAYMTDLNGTIKSGDQLTISPIAGMLMKASDDDTFVVGTAIEDASNVVDHKDIQTEGGGSRSVIVSFSKVDLQPHFRQVATKRGEASFLIIFGESITGGKKVSQAQVIAALIIFFIILAVEGSIIYGAVQSSIAAIGRNPLARKDIYKQLLQVSWMSLLILTFGFGAIYVILWI